MSLQWNKILFYYTHRSSRCEGVYCTIPISWSLLNKSVFLDGNAFPFPFPFWPLFVESSSPIRIIRFIALIVLYHLCQRRRAKYFRIQTVSKFFNVSKYAVVSHLDSRQSLWCTGCVCLRLTDLRCIQLLIAKRL